MNDEFIPLDPEEGPTLWARRVNKFTIKLVQGTDPINPTKTIFLSSDDLDRLYNEFGE